jgi:hypothetical protein
MLNWLRAASPCHLPLPQPPNLNPPTGAPEGSLALPAPTRSTKRGPRELPSYLRQLNFQHHLANLNPRRRHTAQPTSPPWHRLRRFPDPWLRINKKSTSTRAPCTCNGGDPVFCEFLREAAPVRQREEPGGLGFSLSPQGSTGYMHAYKNRPFFFQNR